MAEPPEKRSFLRGAREKIVLAAAALAFVAAVLGNLEKVTGFFEKLAAPSVRKLEPFPSVKEEPLPSPDEGPPPNLLLPGQDGPESHTPNDPPRTQQRTSRLSPRVPTNLDADFLVRISNHPEVDRMMYRSAVTVESVQRADKNGGVADMWFDVIVRNPTGEDILLTAAVYDSGFTVARGDNEDLPQLLPNAVYELTYRPANQGRLPLHPTYLVRKGSIQAIRFHLKPETPGNYDGLIHTFNLWLVEPNGRFVHAVNSMIEPEDKIRAAAECRRARRKLAASVTPLQSQVAEAMIRGSCDTK
jgi:hypothetical protein